MLTETRESFDRRTKDIVNTFGDGEYTVGDVLNAGVSILAGAVEAAGDFLVAGVKDLGKAIGGFLISLADGIKCVFGEGDW